jgi:hypothetical protein
MRTGMWIQQLGMLLAVALIAHVPCAWAQEQRTAEPVTVTGVVVEAETGSPIPGAAILLGDRGNAVLTDRQGRFSARGVHPGAHSVKVVQLGYDTLFTEVQVSAEPAPITIALTPNPVVLERLTALVDRFESRRNALGTSVRAFDQMGLQRGAGNLLDFVVYRGGIRPSPCASPVSFEPCAFVRGRSTPVRVYVDGIRLLGGLDVLASYHPEEIHTLEVIGGGRWIRAYTNWFVENVITGRTIPHEFIF